MADSYKHMAIDDMESIWGGSFKKARASLDLDAFGLGVMHLPPNVDRLPAHVHTFDGQEEIYIPLAGSGQMEVGGVLIDVDPDTAVRVGPTALRRPISGPEGLTLLIAGAIPGEPYTPFPQMEKGVPDPNPAELPGIIAAQSHESSKDFTAQRIDGSITISGVVPGVSFAPLGNAIGLDALGMAVIELDPVDESHYPLHTHEDDNQTEVYVVTEGVGTVDIEGEEVTVDTFEMINIAPQARRKWSAASDEGVRLIAIGAPSGEPYAGNRPTQL